MSVAIVLICRMCLRVYRCVIALTEFAQTQEAISSTDGEKKNKKDKSDKVQFVLKH